MFNFFKSSAFVKSFFVFGAAFFATLSISCKQLATFEPVVDGNQTVVGGGGTTSETTEFAFNLKATHGLVRKISLEWTAFSGAKYYEIYFAESRSAEFVKIGETEQPFFDDAVGAGRTGYFKVCAVKANGASSPFSSTVVGTSLAVPIISDGEVGEFEANISWSMENARGVDGTDYYEKTLKFEVVCQPKGGSDGETKVLSASSFSGSSYSCKFENLSSSQDYEFYIKAYLDGDTQSCETSPTVDKTTLTAYTPLAPKFFASEGDNANGISLLITLPEMVTVRTFVKDSENPKEKQDVPYPLCFEIYRKLEKTETYPEEPVGGVTIDKKKCKWYYNGTKLTKDPVEYKETGGAPYEAGKQVMWFDDDASLIGGEKYDYRIISVPDINYSKVVYPDDDDKQYANEDGKITPVDKATTAQGWKSAHPSFDVKFGEDGGRTLSADKTKVVSVSFGFSAEWNDLGKAGDYKFALSQTYTPFASETDGTPSWLKNGETIFFETLDGIKALVQTFGSASELPKNEQGTYSYTLFIVSKNDNGTADIENKDNILDSMTARNRVVVTEEVSLPKAELELQGGYKNKVHYKFVCEQDVNYRLERTKIVDSKPTNEIAYIKLENTPASGTFEGDDMTVQDNCSYSYVLKAIATSDVFALSTSQVAETLGTPDVSFRKEERYFGYDSVTISFDGVLAAENYVVKLGEGGGFGGGKSFQFASGFSGSTGNAEVSLEGNTYTVTIKGPEGYDNARLAGTKANVTVTAHSSNDNAPSGGVPVKVLGPATLVATVNTFENANEDYITVSWNKVDDAKGYLIRRVMYSDAEMKSVAAESEVTYYCDVSGKVTLVDDDEMNLSGRIDPPDPIKDGKFTLKDIYKDTNSTTSGYEKAQAQIFWGLPFQYIVLPVLGEKDFDFESNSLKPTRNSIAAYTNFQEKQTEGVATLGYGMEVHAEKSKNTEKQTITWVKPYYASKTAPRVFRKLVYGNGTERNFSLVGGSAYLPLGVNAFEYTLEDDGKYNAYEYIVQYGVVNTPTVKEGLRKDFEERKDAESPTEQANKGYLFTVEDFNLATCNLAATQGGNNTYAERVTWNTKMQAWDYKGRALGPTGIKLYVRNNNLDDQWHEVATINSIDYSGEITSNSEEDVSAAKSKEGDGISLYPTSCASGSGATNGALKVLRDYKHYYALSLTRGDLETQKYTPGFDNYSDKTAVYAYRQITDEELVRAATLAMSIGFERAWSKNSSDPWSRTKGDRKYTESSPGSGKITYKTSTGLAWNYNPGTTLEYDSLCINLETKSKESLSAFVTISGTIKGDAPSYTAICPPEKYYGTLTVSSPISFYNNASIDFDLKKNSGSIKVTRNGSNASFGNITPLPFAGSSPSYSFEGHNDSEEWQ